jgi:hypothetical protein
MRVLNVRKVRLKMNAPLDFTKVVVRKMANNSSIQLPQKLKKSCNQDMKRLIRRADFLDERISQNPKRNLDFDAAESNAIRRVVSRCEDMEEILEDLKTPELSDAECDFWEELLEDTVDIPIEELIKKMYSAVLTQPWRKDANEK